MAGRPGRECHLPDGAPPPFSAATIEALEAWADARLDVSDPIEWAKAPDALRAILAGRFGWEAVRGPGVLTWREAQLSLQLEVEERIGRRLRERVAEINAEQDAAAASLRRVAE